jgi:hypothetical protein
MKNFSDYFEGQPAIVNPRAKFGFAFALRTAPWPFEDGFKLQFSNVFHKTIFETLITNSVPPGSVTFTPPEKALRISSSGIGQTGWFALGSNSPGRSFGITIDDEVFQIRSEGINLSNLVQLAGDVFQPVVATLLRSELAEPLLLNDRCFSVLHSFTSTIRLGADKVQQQPTLNCRLMTEALSMDAPPNANGMKSVRSAIPSIGGEDYIRIDYNQHTLKTINGRRAKIITKVEAPYNEQNSILSLTNVYELEKDFDFALQYAADWETPFAHFLRDIIMKRFLDNLLCNTEFSYDI